MRSIIYEVFAFIKRRRMWRLFPVVAMLFVAALLVVVSQGSAISPFIYEFFQSFVWST